MLRAVLVGEELLDEEVAVLKGQLLAVLALHYRLVVIKGVEGERIEVLERVEHQLGLPLHREVHVELNRVVPPPEQVRLELPVGSTLHAREPLEPTALVHRKDQEDLGGALVAPREGLAQLARGPEGRRPDEVFDRSLHRVEVHALHNEEARVLLVGRRLLDFLEPLLVLDLIEVVVVKALVVPVTTARTAPLEKVASSPACLMSSPPTYRRCS